MMKDFPAGAGVNPASSRVAPNTRTFPRTSGGDPNVRNMDMDGTSFSLCEDETGCLERLKAVDTFSPQGRGGEPKYQMAIRGGWIFSLHRQG